MLGTDWRQLIATVFDYRAMQSARYSLFNDAEQVLAELTQVRASQPSEHASSTLLRVKPARKAE